jgi:hypothetical protein
MAALKDEVIRPDVIFALGPVPDTRPVSEPQAAPLRLSLRHFQALSTPQTLDSLVIHLPALTLQQCRDPAVAIPPILRR